MWVVEQPPPPPSPNCLLHSADCDSGVAPPDEFTHRQHQSHVHEEETLLCFRLEVRGSDVGVERVCRGPRQRGGGRAGVRVLYSSCTGMCLWRLLKSRIFLPEPPPDPLLPADLHTGRRVMKQALLEIHHRGEPRRFSPSSSSLSPRPGQTERRGGRLSSRGTCSSRGVELQTSQGEELVGVGK